MCSYMDRFIVVFGGAGNYMTKLKRRETFDDLYIWDAANSDSYNRSSMKPGSYEAKQEQPKWIDMND